jgi:hypothetical protein
VKYALFLIEEFTIKPDEKEMVVIDVFKEKDTGFVGAIGELVAWKYLWRHKGIFCVGFGTRIPFAGTWSEESKFLNRELSKQQVDYLKHLAKHLDSSERAYDFIGHLKGENCFRYLIEVKTTRQGTLHDTRKKVDEIMKAKSLGFIPLLVHVEFLQNWKFKVICMQL